MNLKCYTLLCQTNTYQGIIFYGKIALWQNEANVKLKDLVFTNTWMPFSYHYEIIKYWIGIYRKVEIIFIQSFFFWEQCEKSDHDCLVKQDAHSFFVDAREFSVGVHKLIAMITMQINPSFYCNYFVQEKMVKCKTVTYVAYVYQATK